MEKNARIVIIGSGASGIGAAVKLIENGFEDVLILEASDRIGGRVNSIPFGSKGAFVDLGAQWVSGKNFVYDLMKDHFEFGETDLEIESKEFFTLNGEKIEKSKVVKLSTLGETLFMDTEELKKSDELYGDYFTRRYLEAMKLPEYEDISEELRDQMLIHHHNEFNLIYASADWNEIPAKLVGELIFVEGSQQMTWKKSGYITLLNFLINRVQASHQLNLNEKIFFNKKVVNIDWSSAKAIIKCEDGSEYSADHAITTIPHGVIRARYESLFNPSLPDEKVEAIHGVAFGTFGKVFLEFEENFFPEGVHSFVVLWNEYDLKEVRGTDREWLADVHSFMYVDANENLVEACLAGKHMKKFETYNDAKIINDLMWLLEKFLRKPLTPPCNMRRTNWQTNDNFLGSYAYPSAKTTSSTVDQLGKSICDVTGKPIVLFGGEVTSKRYQGYVHGALEAGWRVADEISDHYRVKDE